MDGSTPFKPARVLRAADVIPPFENDSASSNNPTSRDPIPTFDLAESILAEQRRLASGKRKRARSAGSSGAVEPERVRMEETPPVHPPAAAALIPPYDLAELHQVVAGIVSRDIERLCTGPVVAL